jgi:hypothetical protein
LHKKNFARQDSLTSTDKQHDLLEEVSEFPEFSILNDSKMKTAKNEDFEEEKIPKFPKEILEENNSDFNFDINADLILTKKHSAPERVNHNNFDVTYKSVTKDTNYNRKIRNKDLYNISNDEDWYRQNWKTNRYSNKSYKSLSNKNSNCDFEENLFKDLGDEDTNDFEFKEIEGYGKVDKNYT